MFFKHNAQVLNIDLDFRTGEVFGAKLTTRHVVSDILSFRLTLQANMPAE